MSSFDRALARPIPGPGLAEFIGAPTVAEGSRTERGHALAAGTPLASDAEIVEALQTIHDPEIPVNIYDLGLIYDIARPDNGDVDITMTLTAPACPVAGELVRQVAETVAALDGVGLVGVTLTWEPRWTRDRMSEDAKLALDMF